MVDSALPPEAPVVLGRYRLVDRLGTGGSATVWRAFDERSSRHVALKLVHAHLAGDPAALARLRAEAASTRSLAHPAIPRLLEAHLDADPPALAFEYAEGETLARRLRREGRLEAGEAAHVALQLASGIAHAHGHGIIHRDVKPSNVLLGTDGRVRLLDFGISAPAGEPTASEAGTVVGTLPYMPPEQLAGGPAEPPSDVYALGVLLYQLAAGRLPYPAEGRLALAKSQRTPPPMVAGAGSVLAAVAMPALAYEAQRRPTAAQLVEMLRGASAQLGEATTETMAALLPAAAAAPFAAAGTSSGMGRGRGRWLLPIAGGSAAGAVLVVALAVAVPGAGPASSPPQSPPTVPGPLLGDGPQPPAGRAEPVAEATNDPAPAPTARPAPRTVDKANGRGDNTNAKGGKKEAEKGKKGKAGEGRGKPRDGDDDDDDD